MFKKIMKDKYLDCYPRCLRPHGRCQPVKSGQVDCADISCHYQHFHLYIEAEMPMIKAAQEVTL